MRTKIRAPVTAANTFDPDLVTRASEGDEAARAQLVEAVRSRVRAWCRSILGDAERAEDATQDALLCLWRHIGSLKDPQAFPNWLYRTALSACLYERRRQARYTDAVLPDSSAPQVAAAGPTPEEIAASRQELEGLLSTLRADERSIVDMRYRQGLSARDIGHRLNVSEGAARMRLHEVIARLRRLARPPGRGD